MKRKLFPIFLLVIICGCSNPSPSDEVKRTVGRYNQLIIEGYRRQNMNPLQEVATPELAEKAYYHMAAIGEGKLKMDSTLKKIEFRPPEFRDSEHAVVETREVWDFTQYDTTTGKKFYEEKDFVYTMAYELQRTSSRWIIVRVNTVSGESTKNTVPWPLKSHRAGGKETLPAR